MTRRPTGRQPRIDGPDAIYAGIVIHIQRQRHPDFRLIESIFEEFEPGMECLKLYWPVLQTYLVGQQPNVSGSNAWHLAMQLALSYRYQPMIRGLKEIIYAEQEGQMEHVVAHDLRVLESIKTAS